MFQEALDNIIEVKRGLVCIFDWKEYSKRYPDLLKEKIVTRRELIHHMIHHGQYNNRILLDIDGNRYTHVFKKDVYEKKMNQQFATDEGAYMHYCDHKKKCRFDWKAYAKRYPDLLKAGITTRRQLIWHMIHHGVGNKRTLLDDDGHQYNHVFKKDLYEKEINQKFATDEGAYMHYCDHKKDIILECEQLKIKYKYLQSYTGDLSLDDAKRRVMNYKTILEVRQHEQNNISFKNVCIILYNNYHKIDIKAKLGDNNILHGNNTILYCNNTTAIAIEENGINMDKLENIKEDDMNNIKKNIHRFNDGIKKYKNVLFICGDYPGYGGAATNCYELQQYFKSLKYNTFGFYFNYEKGANAKYEKYEDYMIDDMDKCTSFDFKPDIIILKSPVNLDLNSIYKCPVYYVVGGIYTNNLDKYYYNLKTKEEHDKYINKEVLKHIAQYENSFVNSQHTADILKKFYGITINIFYSSLVQHLNKTVEVDVNFDERKYNYGLIVSNFERKIKNVE